MQKYDVAIIGAGPAGLFCARKLHSNSKEIAVFEKTGHIGGRLATKVVDGHRFNVGVNSFGSTVDELNEMIEAGIADEILIRDGVEIKPGNAISDWTEKLAKDLEVRKRHKVEKIMVGENENILEFDDQESVAAKDVIITVPAPQAAKMLEASGMEAKELRKAKYSSLIHYMFSSKEEIKDPADFKVLHHVKEDGKHFYLMAFTKDWSDKPSDILREEFDLAFKPLESYVRKWKYAKVTRPISSDCQMALKEKSIYLAGDYFFGDKMDSAILSSQTILEDTFHIM